MFLLILGTFFTYFSILSFMIMSYIQVKYNSPLKFQFSKFWKFAALNSLNSEWISPNLLIVTLISSNPGSTANGFVCRYFGFRKFHAAFSLTKLLEVNNFFSLSLYVVRESSSEFSSLLKLVCSIPRKFRIFETSYSPKISIQSWVCWLVKIRLIWK